MILLLVEIYYYYFKSDSFTSSTVSDWYMSTLEMCSQPQSFLIPLPNPILFLSVLPFVIEQVCLFESFDSLVKRLRLETSHGLVDVVLLPEDEEVEAEHEQAGRNGVVLRHRPVILKRIVSYWKQQYSTLNSFFQIIRFIYLRIVG